MRVRLSASAPKGEPQPCIRQSPRAPASRGSVARRGVPGSRTASPGERPIPRGSSSRGTTASARNGHPPNRSCKLGSSSVRQNPWSLAPGSSLVPFPFLCIGQYVCCSSRRSPSLKKLSSSAPLRPQRHQGSKHVVLVASSIRPIFSGTWALLTDSELLRTPSKRSSRGSLICPIAPVRRAYSMGAHKEGRD